MAKRLGRKIGREYTYSREWEDVKEIFLKPLQRQAVLRISGRGSETVYGVSKVRILTLFIPLFSPFQQPDEIQVTPLGMDISIRPNVGKMSVGLYQSGDKRELHIFDLYR